MPLPDPCPDLASLDLLVSVGELGSISAAAAAHGISQPAASMRLRALEQQLAIPLLDRATTGARLTTAGAATAEWASAVLGDVHTLLSGAAALRADRDSHVHLAASLTVAEYLILPWLHQLRSEHPGIKTSIEMGNSAHVVELVKEGRVELGFIEGARPPRRLRSRELLADELVIVASPAHPWSRRRQAVEPEELASTPLVLREAGSGTRDVLADALSSHQLGITTAMELGSTTAIKAATIAGTAPSVLSALAVRHELASGQLVAVQCAGLSFERVIRAVWAPTRSPSGATARLVDIASRSGNALP